MNIRLLSAVLTPFAVLMLAAAPTTGPARQADDARPVVPDAPGGPEKAAKNSLPTLWLVGDSTMNSNGKNADSGRELRGWASEMGAFFDKSKINVVNRAIGGRSSKTFVMEGRWDKVLAEMKKGDFVIVQFGHNDNARWDDPAAKYRPALPGEGEETGDLTLPDGTKQHIHTYGWYMRHYASDAHAKGATPILATMVPHKDFAKRGERRTFVTWTRNAAQATGALFIDLNETIAEQYANAGAEKVAGYFADARTHTSIEGAQNTARIAVGTMKSLPVNPLEPYLNDAGKALPVITVMAPEPAPEPAREPATQETK